MPEATPEDLVSLGIEVDYKPAPQPERMAFEQVDDLPDEPITDVKIRLEDGTELRERVEVRQTGAGITFAISNALLTKAGKVAKDHRGDFRIVPGEVVHELQIDGVRAGTMKPAELEEAKQQAREVAAAKARNFFKGVDRVRELFAGRLPQ